MVRSLADRLGAFLVRTPSPPVDEQWPLETCTSCKASLVDEPLYLEQHVCPACRFHYPIAARERIELLADPGSFRESQRSIVSLGLAASSQMQRRRDRRRTGLTEAAITGRASIGGVPVILIVLDYRFLGGTLGAVMGEKVALAFEMGTRRKLPVVAVITSGGARMQDGVLSLMQLAKTSVAVNGLHQAGLPFISVLADPTTGQAFSGFANMADVILAEPGAVLGLAPSGQQAGGARKAAASWVSTAEGHLVHGMIDRAVDREHLRSLLVRLLNMMAPRHDDADEASPEHAAGPAAHDEDRLEELWPASWESVRVARGGQLPTSLDLIRRAMPIFEELHGDRLQGDDPSVVAGLGSLGSRPVAVIAQERGHDVSARERHEGRAYPEGFRKAERIMRLASKLRLPLVTLIDTPGPYYGLESEERGLGNAIASAMWRMAQLPVPTVAVVVGEGGSEGALALSVADRLLMLDTATYSVTSPDVRAALLYRDAPRGRRAQAPLILTAHDCQELGIIDDIIDGPPEGSRANPDALALLLRESIERELDALPARSSKRLLRDRFRKYRKMGEYSSHFRVAVTHEIAHLQSYVAHRVRRIRRRRRRARGALPAPESGGGEETGD
ncbi:MAG: acetyl-CoA carboxylase carboxyltransferase subunit alpha/beta [Chloroflexota bacterium]|nr:acetyl-CoA carboxylase carboxyltransferase subunit alpha/beta [Chloroflexota bacterium]MDE2942116.1 acetyl-CoA carboxylase carboxyltransferase subunit alpha/beta [Chloroflexota bacterium]MDE3267962.1 acetyl-CoA carboxylase carboxyltransferase subunit alpha/beta [Chloroflexota bacterium]